MKTLIEKKLIEADAVREGSYTELERVSYKSIHYGFKNCLYTDDCFKEKEIFLKQHITDYKYNGNQFFYYPELTKQIRKLESYPCLNKKYPINTEKKGIEFLNYLAQYANECLQAFKTERLEKYKNLNHLIHLYGYDRHLPLIEQFEEVKGDRGYYSDQILTINGVKWYLDDRGSRNSYTESINMKKLFNISGHYRYIIVDKIILGTPFLALKCCTYSYNTGHVFWYDLSTQQQTTKTNAKAWKKPSY